MKKVIALVLMAISTNAYAESQMYTAPSTEKKSYTRVIKSLEDAKQFKEDEANKEIRARPAFEELNKDLHDSQSNISPNGTESIYTKPVLLRPFDKKRL